MILEFWLCLVLPGCVYRRKGDGNDFAHARVQGSVWIYGCEPHQTEWCMRMSEYSRASSDNEVCLSHAGEAPSATKRPQWQRQVEVLMAAISPGWLLSMCYRNLSSKSPTSRNIVLWHSLEDSCLSLRFLHLMDEREAEEENRAHVPNGLAKARRFSTAELNFPFPRWITLTKNWFQIWKKKPSEKALRWKDGWEIRSPSHFNVYFKHFLCMPFLPCDSELPGTSDGIILIDDA